MDLLKRKGVFLFVIASPPKAGVAISFLGKGNTEIASSLSLLAMTMQRIEN
jgi:hypothetical protein